MECKHRKKHSQSNQRSSFFSQRKCGSRLWGWQFLAWVSAPSLVSPWLGKDCYSNQTVCPHIAVGKSRKQKERGLGHREEMCFRYAPWSCPYISEIRAGWTALCNLWQREGNVTWPLVSLMVLQLRSWVTFPEHSSFWCWPKSRVTIYFKKLFILIGNIQIYREKDLPSADSLWL